MTRNISHKKIIHVAEGAEFHPAAAPARRGTTQLTTAYVSSHFGSGSGLSSLVRGRIEKYGAGRFEKNARNAREGMSLILSLLRNYEPLPATSEYMKNNQQYGRGFNDPTRRQTAPMPKADTTATQESTSPTDRETSQSPAPESFFLSKRRLGLYPKLSDGL